MKKIMVLFGTRPEAIKLAPVIKALKKEKGFKTLVCSTGQHREMLRQVLDIFKIKIDADLDLMKPNQDLFDITVYSVARLKEVLAKYKPDLLIVQGDTSTAFVSALSAFYKKIKIGHVEAGLRSYNIYSPYPEEANRRFISVITNYHWTPTIDSKKCLLSEGIPPKDVYVTGNTVIDALNEVKDLLSKPVHSKKIEQSLQENLPEDFFKKKFVLITMHRREKFGEEFNNSLVAIKELSEKHTELNFVYPVHLNPNVKGPVHFILSKSTNIYLIPPQDYLNFIYLMSKCYFIMSDSGGVQEECFVFRKPIIVMRDVTERNEAIKAGYAFLVGSNPTKIKRQFESINKKLSDGFNYFRTKNPFGDGKASERIVKIIKKDFVE
ncbi:MAG: UDP-N-acetylglucosamine 2-epimerase (non-hydrolyzing) [Ignavibacteriales bacterium]|nr:UDP-N-acetylglucosamine 2-epimerase (non-hydrolyzing) [Ignavibacteriales bacterium]